MPFLFPKASLEVGLAQSALVNVENVYVWLDLI
jgi:hypothetical protein